MVLRSFVLITWCVASISCASPDVPEQFETVTQTFSSGKPKSIQVFSTSDSVKIAAKEFYEAGELKIEMKYSNGKRQGPTYSYYKNGKPWSLNTFENDELHGPYQTWHENGQLYYDGQYTRNKESGVWKFYNETGGLVKTIDYDAIPDSLKGNVNIPRL